MNKNLKEKILSSSQEISGILKEQKEALRKKVIVNLPAYFPDELIYAAGALPVRLWGSKLQPSRADALLQSFSCTLSRTVLEEMLTTGNNLYDAFLFTSMCDTFQNLYEVYRHTDGALPSHMFILPLTSNEEERKNYLALQLQKAISWLESITGQKITELSLQSAIELYQQRYNLLSEVFKRRINGKLPLNNFEFYALIKLSGIIEPNKYLTLLKEVLSLPESPERKGARIMISGIVPEPAGILKVFDELNVNIATDDMMNSERLLTRMPLKSLKPDEIDNFVFNSYPCSTLFNQHNDRREFLLKKIKNNNINGIIFWQIKFCEPEGFDRPQLIDFLKEKGIPSLVVEVELQMKTYENIKTRLQGFIESLEVI